TEKLGAERGLLGYRQVGRARGQDDDRTMTAHRRRLMNYDSDARGRMILERAQLPSDRPGFVRRQTRDDQIQARRRHAAADQGDLLRAFAVAEDHLRHSAPERTMVIEAGETQIVERQGAQAVRGEINRELARRDLREQLADAGGGHRRRWASGRRGRSRCSTTSRTARASLRTTVIVTLPALSCSPGFGICPSRSTTRPPMVAYSPSSGSLRPKRSFRLATSACAATTSVRGPVTRASSSRTSCSSSISPTTSSSRSSIVMIPAAPPYSSTTTARLSRVRCRAIRISSSGVASGK